MNKIMIRVQRVMKWYVWCCSHRGHYEKKNKKGYS